MIKVMFFSAGHDHVAYINTDERLEGEKIAWYVNKAMETGTVNVPPEYASPVARILESLGAQGVEVGFCTPDDAFKFTKSLRNNAE